MNIEYNLENYPEYKLFFLVDECNAYIKTSGEILIDENINENEKSIILNSAIKVRKIRLKIAEELKTRYNLIMMDEVCKFTPEFIVWYKKWDSWRNSFDENQWNIIMDKVVASESIDEYLSK